METVVFTAQAFGFGPVSKMLAVSEGLSDVRKIFFGSGVSYDLASLHRFDEIHNFDHEDKEKILLLLNQADLFIDVMDFSLGSLAKAVSCPYFLIDSLFWFWPKQPEDVELADIYFCQNFFIPIEMKIRESQLANTQVIGPIVNTHFTRYPKKAQAIVNFGGMECPFIEIGKNSNYPFIILKNLLPILRQRFSHILVTGRERVLRMCRDKFPEDEALQFRMLDQKSMLEELYCSKALFTTPGIQTFYDSADKLPIFCLPPNSNSQFKNLDCLLRNNAVKHCFHLRGIYDIDLSDGLSDGEEIAVVLEKMRIFEASEKDQAVFRDTVRHFLENQHIWKNLVSLQENALKNLGENGANAVIREIKRLLFDKKRKELAVTV